VFVRGAIGSVLRPILFGMYVSPVGDVITQHNIRYHQYADNLQTYMSLTPTLNRSCECSTTKNALLLNPAKMEAVFFGTHQQLSQLNTSQGIDVAGTHIQFTDAVKLLGVTLDSTLSFDKHVADVAR